MGYKEINALNQSILKKILISPQSFLQAQKKQAEPDDSSEEHFVFGTVVDIMLTGSREEFEEKFVKIPDETRCSETIKGIVKSVYEEVSIDENEVESLEIYDIAILKYANYADYQRKWKDETKVDKIVEEGKSYFELLKTIGNKIPITETDYAKAVACLIALKSNEFTQPYTVLKSSTNNREFLDKFIIEFEYQGLNIKGELDRVVIDHTNKVITPIDFKTTGKPISGFVGDFWYYRYDFQAAVYSRGLCEHPDIKKLLESNYSLNPFLYIAVETNLVNQPMVFEVDSEVVEVGINGGVVNNRTYEGFAQAIARYKYAVINDAWDYPMEYYQNGKITITV
jgi:hypothetical protein